MSTFYDYLIEDIDDVVKTEVNKVAASDEKAEKEISEIDLSKFTKTEVRFDTIKEIVQQALNSPENTHERNMYLKRLKKLMLSIKGTRGFSSMSWWKRLQYFYNAYIAESAIVDACKEAGQSVNYADIDDGDNDEENNSHTILRKPKGNASGKPDLSYDTGKLEVKIFASESSIRNYSDSSFHNADYVVIYVLRNNSIIFKQKTGSGYETISADKIPDENMKAIANTILTKTTKAFNEFIRLEPDQSKIQDYKFIKITPLSKPNNTENEEN